jgi:hypothetical protein
LGLFGGDAPTYNQPVLSGAADQVIGNTVNNQALGTQPQYAQAALQGTQNSGAMVSNLGNQLTNENNALGGGGMPGMQAAIQNKQMKNYNISQGNLGNQANLWGVQTQMDRTTQAANTLNNLSDMEWGVANFSNNADIATQGARNAVIGGVFQGAGALGGAIAGGAFSGGPAQPSPFQSTITNSNELQTLGANNTFQGPGMVS